MFTLAASLLFTHYSHKLRNTVNWAGIYSRLKSVHKLCGHPLCMDTMLFFGYNFILLQCEFYVIILLLVKQIATAIKRGL
jgi:hypothetical protein